MQAGDMNAFRTFFDQHAAVFWLILVAFTVVLAIWLWRTYQSMRRLQLHFEDVLSGVSGENSIQMLTEYLGTVRSTANTVSRIQEEHRRIADLMPTIVRHVGLVRFSPFHDTGGDQSFALAVLDGRGDGVVITGLHSRHDSRLYAKPIAGGESDYSLTPEEREAMSRAMQGDREHAHR